ncbi:hypothetical protein ACFUJU_07860 [Streptomyces sp. NPDC057235]|uniref:hypothetical protein n=1 Tax=Streptomyces sp. NPDC057235 TaxID=3346058 RepID=UPI00363BE63B
MASSKEWYEVSGETYSNLEEATEGARSYARVMDKAVEIYRITAVPVRCIKREISLTETDITAPPGA